MKLVKSSVEIIPQEFGLSGAYKQIEIAARTCYKSEDRICEGSAKKMVDFLLEKGHYSPLEHGTIYLKVPNGHSIVEWYDVNPYSRVNTVGEYAYITTNARVITENECHSDLKYMCEPTKHHEKRVTVRVICDRGITHEWVRHRTMSFSQESTRYCNYSKSKFDSSVTFIKPDWVNEIDISEFKEDCTVIESLYFKWLNKGYTPQLARYFLNTGLKTEMIVTAFVSDWKHFFELRTSDAAHPDIKKLSISLKAKFKKNKLI